MQYNCRPTNVKGTVAMSRDERSTVTAEQEVLQHLCATDLPARERRRALDMLATYGWHEPEHATVFHAIQRISSARSPSWRDELPAMATRMGFPEVDWSRYFGAASRGGPALQVLMASLI